LFEEAREPAKKAGSVGWCGGQRFFGLNFFVYFLFSRKESKNQRRNIGEVEM
jgi:hypothetical protein